MAAKKSAKKSAKATKKSAKKAVKTVKKTRKARRAPVKTKLYLARKAKGLTQAQVAAKAKVSQPTYCAIEHGDKGTPESIARVKKVLGVK